MLEHLTERKNRREDVVRETEDGTRDLVSQGAKGCATGFNDLVAVCVASVSMHCSWCDEQ